MKTFCCKLQKQLNKIYMYIVVCMCIYYYIVYTFINNQRTSISKLNFFHSAHSSSVNKCKQISWMCFIVIYLFYIFCFFHSRFFFQLFRLFFIVFCATRHRRLRWVSLSCLAIVSYVLSECASVCEWVVCLCVWVYQLCVYVKQTVFFFAGFIKIPRNSTTANVL